ncbi:MAG TPA: pyridoxal phosphate-dependent aminotransferase [Bacteroidia bacterium]|jgi:aspartate/methionine/tyrosine aminotransferase|nr:pyridoxal phosphate-dependent aminotransferase [Bacteroidia bacterium]
MNIQKSGATFSSIVGIGVKLKKLSEESGEEYLFLNRGVNAVCPIDLSDTIRHIDFNSPRIQVYPANKGTVELREAINGEYFQGASDTENISIVPGGMPAIDLTVQALRLDKLYFSHYFWGSYAKLAKIRGIDTGTYASLSELIVTIQKEPAGKNSAVLICDPNNPIGNKLEDSYLLECIRKLNDLEVVVLFDSPYRRIFCGSEDSLFLELSKLPNVIITESFSKAYGLSGQRIGFIHSSNQEFNKELNIRILYSMNGVNAFAQELIWKLISTSEGKKAVTDFRKKTADDIGKNIAYLQEQGLLKENLYEGSRPLGIFAVINKSEEFLLKYRIGSVSMNYFTLNKNEETASMSRICVSVPHEKFKLFFDRVPKECLSEAE